MPRSLTQLLVALLSSGLVFSVARAQSPSKPTPTPHMHAKGTFEVTVEPVSLANAQASPNLGRMTLDKHYTGDLEGTGKGEMLSSRSADGSGGYVAIEQVDGTLAGRKGGFVLQHSASMVAGSIQLFEISVVPGSGTGELVGLRGNFAIKVKDGQHLYEFDYQLPQ